MLSKRGLNPAPRLSCFTVAGARSVNRDEFVTPSKFVEFRVFFLDPILLRLNTWLFPRVGFFLRLEENVVIYICVLIAREILAAAFPSRNEVSEVVGPKNFIHHNF